jgi:putative SOS response-associated peptidase YedK
MCGRFVLMTPSKSLAAHFCVSEEPSLEPHYNIAPSQRIAAVRFDPGKPGREVVLLKWGLVPSWAKDLTIGSRLINARSETVADKPVFRSAFRRRRCLIPADGFYEWKKLEGGKRPYFLSMANARVFAFAGLWEHRSDPNGESIESCCILTTDANELVTPIHDRMPVILPESDYDRWLDPSVNRPELLMGLLRPYPAEAMAAYPVGTKVNRAEYDGPELIEPVR